MKWVNEGPIRPALRMLRNVETPWWSCLPKAMHGPLLLAAAQRGEPLQSGELSGNYAAGLGALVEGLEAIGFTLFERRYGASFDVESASTVLANERGYVVVQPGPGHDRCRMRLAWFSHDPGLPSAMEALSADFDRTEINKRALYVIAQGRHGLTMSVASRDIARPLERGNYGAPTLAAYDRAVADLQLSDPGGRLVIIDGPTGTGKTWMIRGLMDACPHARFIHCSPTLVASLNGPDFMPLLMEDRLMNEVSIGSDGVPLVLIIEDGDACLLKRAGDNMNQIQALLNTVDGLMSAAFDLRAIVTTNSSHLRNRNEEIDEAMTRAGRLSERITVPKLDGPHHYAVLERLVGGPEIEQDARMAHDKRYSLAEVYAHARMLGWTPAALPHTVPPRRGGATREREILGRRGY